MQSSAYLWCIKKFLRNVSDRRFNGLSRRGWPIPNVHQQLIERLRLSPAQALHLSIALPLLALCTGRIPPACLPNMFAHLHCNSGGDVSLVQMHITVYSLTRIALTRKPRPGTHASCGSLADPARSGDLYYHLLLYSYRFEAELALLLAYREI